jgi:hypothetical protein
VAEQVAALEALRASLEAPWLASDPRRAASARAAAAQLDRFLARLRPLGTDRQAELDRFERSLTGALPEQLRLLWRALEPEPIELADLPAPLARRMVSPEGLARVEVLPREDLADNRAHARFVDAVRAAVPNATGSAVTLLEWGRAVVRSFREALALSTLVIALLLWALWRSLRDMAIAMAPLALAALLLAATSVALGIPFNFANVVVLPLLLGIGVDSGIHLVHRHRDALERGGARGEIDQELLETSTAQAILYSALTTMASFGSLAFSNHVGFASMGQLLLLGVACTLAANLLLVPALIELERPARAPELAREPT